MILFKKIGAFFKKIFPTKRRLIQLYSALLYNANMKGFLTGRIFQGVSKTLCVPGLNCYSCPGAVGACPLGSLQNALASSKTKYPTYVIGIILLYCIIFGRTICGFLCPVGFMQELLYKIKTPKVKKSRVTRVLSYFKYVLLVVLVMAIPLIYGLQKQSMTVPGFCKYICPAGTFEGAIFLLAHPNNSDFYGMLGSIFTWKFFLLIIFVIAAVFIYRFFCRFFCPLGAIYGFFNKLSVLGIKVDKNKCDHCGACVSHCKMDVKEVGDHECINCGDCKKVCHVNAIDWKVVDQLVKEKDQKNVIVSEEETVQNSYKKRKFSKEYILNLVTTIILAILLVVTIIYASFSEKKVVAVNEVCEEFVVSLSDGNTFDISIDEKATLLYFYDELNVDEINHVNTFVDERLNIIAIGSFDNQSESQQIIDTLNVQMQFAFDNKGNDLLEVFAKESAYPYFVFMDNADKVIIKQSSMISNAEYSGIIYPSISGLTIGSDVGDICINQNLNLIKSDGVFSVLENRGKVTVLNFWFTTCGPCVQELPYFNAIAREYQDALTVVAIHEAGKYANDPEGVRTFITNSGWDNWQVVFAYDDILSPYYTALGGKEAFPTTIIVDQNGVVSFIKPGPIKEDDLRAQIELLINK